MRRGLVPRSPLRLRGGLGLVALSLPFALLSLALIPGCNEDTIVPQSNCDDPGVLCTYAGTGQAGFNGDGKTLLKSAFYWPVDMTITSDGELYILDWNNHRIRHLKTDGKLETVVGTQNLGDGPCEGFLSGCPYTDLTLPGAPGREISLNHPTEILELPDGRMLFSAWHNHKLRTYDPVTGLVWVMCGRGAGFVGDGGPVESALVNQPAQIAVSPVGEIFVLDQRNQRLRRVGIDGTIATIAGTGVAGYSGDGGAPLMAQMRFPAGSNPPPAGGIVLDAQGRVYFSDTLNHRVRRVDLGLNLIETVAGNGTAGYSGDNGLAVNAQINNPRDVEIGPDGRLYVADEKNHRIRAIDLTTGIITTVAGNGTKGFSGEGALAIDAALNSPTGIAFDGEGRLYIADTENNRIRRVTL